MSGHSKWSSIKRKKGANDEKRGRMFAKLLRAVEVAAREGGANVEGNMTLASAVQKARDYSVPTDNIERAVRRGAGETGGARFAARRLGEWKADAVLATVREAQALAALPRTEAEAWRTLWRDVDAARERASALAFE